MENCHDAAVWPLACHEQAIGIWAQLQQTKALVCEPHGTGEAFDSAMKTYYDAIAAGQGAIFFAICRGKVGPCQWSTALHTMRAFIVQV